MKEYITHTSCKKESLDEWLNKNSENYKLYGFAGNGESYVIAVMKKRQFVPVQKQKVDLIEKIRNILKSQKTPDTRLKDIIRLLKNE